MPWCPFTAIQALTRTVYMFILVPIPYTFYYCVSVMYLDVWNSKLFSNLFLLRISLALLGSSLALYIFQNYFSILWRMFWVFWLGLHYLCNYFWEGERSHNMNITNLETQDAFPFSSFFLSSFRQRFEVSVVEDLVMFIPRYIIMLNATIH